MGIARYDVILGIGIGAIYLAILYNARSARKCITFVVDTEPRHLISVKKRMSCIVLRKLDDVRKPTVQCDIGRKFVRIFESIHLIEDTRQENVLDS